MVSDFKNDVVTNLPDITSISFTRIDKKYEVWVLYETSMVGMRKGESGRGSGQAWQ